MEEQWKDLECDECHGEGCDRCNKTGYDPVRHPEQVAAVRTYPPDDDPFEGCCWACGGEGCDNCFDSGYINVMPFPPEYREDILSGVKTMTHRVSAELGKYKVCHFYNAVGEDQSGRWCQVFVMSVERIPIDQAPEEVRKMADGPEADVIRFKICQ